MELIQKYSVSEIITFIILAALAVKGCITFFQWFFPKVKKMVYKVDEPTKIKTHINNNRKEIDDLKKSIGALTSKVDTLVSSDRDDIKAFITREHHYFCYQKGWIDDYSLDCIERRYTHYVDQGGNSFIQGLMQEIRDLPKQDPQLTK